MIRNNSSEMQARQALAQRQDAKEIVGWLRQFKLGKRDAVLLAILQSVTGFGLIGLLDGPWSLPGYCFATASVLMFWRMKAVLAEFDREDGVGRD